LEFIVRRPQSGHREVLEEGELNPLDGLVGDNWRTRGSSLTADGSSNPDMQLNIMNSRVIALLTRSRNCWQLSGDQLFIDLDLSTRNLPPGTHVLVGSAVVEVTAQPHTSCRRFMTNFGHDAVTFINSPVGKQLRLRGINAKVIQAGHIRVGDAITRLGPVRT
jgi:hypothetical protein